MERKRNVMESVSELDREPRGELVVAANEATCLHILPEVFAAFKRQFPDVSVNIRRGERAWIIEQVLENTVDFGVVSTPVEDARLVAHIIHHDKLVVITEAGHPLGWQNTASAEDIASYPLLLPKVGRTRGAIEDFFERKKLKYKVSMELDSSELLKRFVAAGVGVGFIASSNVNGDVRAKILSAVPIEGDPIQRVMALVHRKDKTLSLAARTFQEITRKIDSEMV